MKMVCKQRRLRTTVQSDQNITCSHGQSLYPGYPALRKTGDHNKIARCTDSLCRCKKAHTYFGVADN